MNKLDMTPAGIAERTYKLIKDDIETIDECKSPSVILNISEQLGRYKKALARIENDLSRWDRSVIIFSIYKLEKKLNGVN